MSDTFVPDILYYLNLALTNLYSVFIFQIQDFVSFTGCNGKAVLPVLCPSEAGSQEKSRRGFFGGRLRRAPSCAAEPHRLGSPPFPPYLFIHKYFKV